jgi:glycosyltransferase involved in cell wall biosynthesis
MTKIYYWSPHLSNDIATIKSVKNSAISFKDYSNNYSISILDAVGEWTSHKELFLNKNIDIISLGKNIYNSLLRGSFLKSRFSYIKIFLFSFFPLLNILKKNKPDYLIVHLITSLPIFIFLIFKLKTKLILRISGLPKLNFFRYYFWKIANNKILYVICPSKATYEYLIKIKIFDSKKIFLINDPIIDINEFKFFKKKKIEDDNFFLNNIVLAGRLTKQKNFILFINAFKEILKKIPKFKANIIGKGEDKMLLEKKIKDINLSNDIYLSGYKENLYSYFYNSKFFILTSLWEDPGFVLVEAAMCNLILISSDCPNGPAEFLNYGNYGFLYKSNSTEDLINKVIEAHNCSEDIQRQKKFLAKKNCLNYTKFKHFNKLQALINKNILC